MSLPDLITPDRAMQNASFATLQASTTDYLASLITSGHRNVIRRRCNRDFVQAAYTEYYSGGIYTNAPIRLRQFPVLEITRVAANPLPALRVINLDGAPTSGRRLRPPCRGDVVQHGIGRADRCQSCVRNVSDNRSIGRGDQYFGGRLVGDGAAAGDHRRFRQVAVGRFQAAAGGGERAGRRGVPGSVQRGSAVDESLAGRRGR